MMPSLTALNEFLHHITRQAGQISLDYRSKLSTLAVGKKNQKELVTEADVAIENYLVGQIQHNYPGHAILGEESGSHAGNDYRWVIDPIDGTASFVHDQPYYSVSIALEHQGQTILGAVYGPILNEFFSAIRGQGALLNGRPIHVSKESTLANAMLSTGFSCLRSNMAVNNLALFTQIMPRIHSIRRLGSAALDLCYTAAARLDGFWELNLNLYDVAAGALILTEAGGKISDFSNTMSLWPSEVLASNTLLHQPLLNIINNTE